jgi:hypothetical protein
MKYFSTKKSNHSLAGASIDGKIFAYFRYHKEFNVEILHEKEL